MLTPALIPRVSVVIPAYNAEAHIARAVDSVLRQTVPVHQLIVVNDGSRDRTAEVLAAYGDRIELISIPNGGVANARNTGLRRVTGDVIALLDADDVWRDDKLEKQLAVFRAHPEVEFTCCNYLSVDIQRGTEIAQFDHVARRHDVFFDQVLAQPLARLLVVNFVGTCSNVAFTRALLERVGLFDASLRQAEDFELWMRMAVATRFYLQSDVLLEKIAHGANLTSRFDETLKYHEKAVLQFRAAHADLFKGSAELDANCRRGLADTRYDIAGILFTKKARREAFAYLRSAWRAERSPRNGARILKRGLRRLLLP